MTEPNDSPHGDRASTPGSPRGRITSRELLGDRKELIIVHGSDEYRLRITSNAKLILTK